LDVKKIFELKPKTREMILQLNPSILVETPLGTGQTLLIIDYGMHQNSCWVVALQETGVIKHFDCNDVILSTNYTYGMNLRHNKFVEEKVNKK
jgi:hypothetical protein